MIRQLILGKNRLSITVQTIVFSAYNGNAEGTINQDWLKNMKVLYLTIMQNLVELLGEDLLREDDEREPKTRPYDQRAWHQLALRARALGFESDKIICLSRTDSDQEMARRALLNARPAELFDYGKELDGLISVVVKLFKKA